eukprot:16438621-Heterocapsa_arctica.AAC.1
MASGRWWPSLGELVLVRLCCLLRLLERSHSLRLRSLLPSSFLLGLLDLDLVPSLGALLVFLLGLLKTGLG